MVLQLLALWLVLVLSALQSASAAKRVIVDDPEKLVHLLPKVELHAHLHGSIRSSTLLELTGDESFTVLEKDLTLEACFQRFSAVYKAVANRQVLERVIGEVLVDFMDDNVVYLELRTTPRSLPDGTTEEEYVQLLVDKVKRHNSLYGHLLSVKLILSVNRSKSYDEGLHILELAEKYRYGTEKDATKSEDPLIVGLDFSGNPNGARFEDFQPIFAEARKVGFNITVHCGETAELSNTPGPSGMDETKSIIKFRYSQVVRRSIYTTQLLHI